jgi:dCMP deaminase
MTWDEYLMGFAKHASEKSKDSTKVGAVLVDPENTVLLTAFNGPPRGVFDLPERFQRPDKYMFASHAETNLISFAARHGIRTQGCKIYCTHFACAACARTVIQAGIVELVFGEGTFMALEAEQHSTQQMLHEAKVQFRKL